MIKKLKEKKGFTLVELIVVLVILAILAALLIPALTGYIDKAKNKSVIAETRQAVMAAQTLVDEEYGKTSAVGGASGIGSITQDDIQKLAEVKGTIDTTKITVSEGKITSLTYVATNGKTCIYSKTAVSDTNTEKYMAEGDYYIKK